MCDGKYNRMVSLGFVFITGILFLSRHGWQLIAGYNMASEEKKAQYDLDCLYVAKGIGMLVLSAFILLSLLLVITGH